MSRHQPADAPGITTQALMELGALVCPCRGRPCGSCPLAGLCRANVAHTAAALPCKAPAKGPAGAAGDPGGRGKPQGVLLQQRPPKGLLAGLWQPPLWEGAALSPAELCSTLTGIGLSLDAAPPAAARGKAHLQPHRMAADRLACPCRSRPPPPGFVWAQPAQLSQEYAPARRLQGLPALSAGAKIKVRLAARRHLNTCCFCSFSVVISPCAGIMEILRIPTREDMPMFLILRTRCAWPIPWQRAHCGSP